jgi:hypothetical protein
MNQRRPFLSRRTGVAALVIALKLERFHHHRVSGMSGNRSGIPSGRTFWTVHFPPFDPTLDAAKYLPPIQRQEIANGENKRP